MGLPRSGWRSLPLQLTRFFGRDSERAELEGLVAEARLVTLTGAPGCGKSRLAIELAAWLAHRFEDGVWLAELAPLADPALAAGAVGMALGIGERPGQTMQDTLVEVLAGRDLLLILDNCEHVAGAVAVLVDALLGSCSSLRVLATSRVALGVGGEQVWRVPPLAGDAAAELFTDRARLDESLDIVGELGDQLAVARRLRGLALVIMTEGDAETATALCEQSAETFRTRDDWRGLVWSLIFLGVAHYVAGDVSGGNASIEEALAVNGSVGSLAATAYGSLYLSYAASMSGDVTIARGRLTGALAALRELGGVVDEPDWLWSGSALAAAEGRVTSALRLEGGAEALSRRSGSHLNEQITETVRHRLDHVRRDVGPTVAARLAAEGSRMTIGELMAEAIAEPQAVGRDPLSPREREVAELVAQGKTNAEIAEALFISKRTVETHVDHIKQKLGHDSRQQVIVWVLREHLESSHP